MAPSRYCSIVLTTKMKIVAYIWCIIQNFICLVKTVYPFQYMLVKQFRIYVLSHVSKKVMRHRNRSFYKTICSFEISVTYLVLVCMLTNLNLQFYFIQHHDERYILLSYKFPEVTDSWCQWKLCSHKLILEPKPIHVHSIYILRVHILKRISSDE